MRSSSPVCAPLNAEAAIRCRTHGDRTKGLYTVH